MTVPLRHCRCYELAYKAMLDARDGVADFIAPASEADRLTLVHGLFHGGFGGSVSAPSAELPAVVELALTVVLVAVLLHYLVAAWAVWLHRPRPRAGRP